MLSPSRVILSAAKDLGISLRVNSAKHLLLLIENKSRFFASLRMTGRRVSPQPPTRLFDDTIKKG